MIKLYKNHSLSRGFTTSELLIVIGLVVIMALFIAGLVVISYVIAHFIGKVW